MIKLINDWELDSDGTGYVVRLNTGKVDKKGNSIYAKTKYPSTIEDGLKIVRRELLKDYIKENDVTMFELIKEMERLNKQFEELLKGSIENE